MAEKKEGPVDKGVALLCGGLLWKVVFAWVEWGSGLVGEGVGVKPQGFERGSQATTDP